MKRELTDRVKVITEFMSHIRGMEAIIGYKTSTAFWQLFTRLCSG